MYLFWIMKSSDLDYPEDYLNIAFLDKSNSYFNF